MGVTREVSVIEVEVGLSFKDLVGALRKLSDEDREFFIENLLAATSPDYLRSIEEAREDYRKAKEDEREGRTASWEEMLQEASRPK